MGQPAGGVAAMNAIFITLADANPSALAAAHHRRLVEDVLRALRFAPDVGRHSTAAD